ncbi:MAG TPA: phosphoribosyltransferase [Thermodesulfobacteriota bacterium]|nr:phosphoribosyltransferase [Thermodesulfobacteriota bacterium]
MRPAHRIHLFQDRKEAGKELAEKLSKYKGVTNLIVLALPRGGVPVAFEVTRHLGAPLDVFITRKLGFPDNPELAIGALAENGEVFLNNDLVNYYTKEYLEEEVLYQKEEIKRRQALYRGELILPAFKNKTVILIDDGVATGATMIATIRALRASGIKKLVVAVPVAPEEIIEELSGLADELVVLYTPSPFIAVGMHYSDFRQVSDAEVKEYLEKAKTIDEPHKEVEK